MAVGLLTGETSSISTRVRRTVALLRRRGYALDASRLGEMCLGGAISELEVRWSAAASPDLAMVEDLVVEHDCTRDVAAIRGRAKGHRTESIAYLALTRDFVRRLVRIAPFIQSVSIAGSLASGGFRATDDVDLNLIVDDGHRHIAYVVVNALGMLHALRYRGKPVDDLTRRPIAPRLMTVNLVLERSQCHPLRRTDEDMAFELLVAQPLYGKDVIDGVIHANAALLGHFPQLAEKSAPFLIDAPRRAPKFLYPAVLDRPARAIGRAAWRYMQWTRRHRPEALARVEYVRSTMRPYTLFDAP
jgi:hypothetical protein